MEEIKVEEIWKDIKDFPNYQVSNFGRVKSNPRPKTKGGILRASKNHSGYLKILLMKNGKRYLMSVHRLVAETFIPNPDELPQVNHLDGNKENNYVNNLEWTTAKNNVLHRFYVLNQEPIRKYKEEKFNHLTKEGRNAYARLYYKKNKEKLLEYGRNWRRKKKEAFASVEYKIGGENE